MSPAHVHEPTYAAIKRRLLHGVWPPGGRLEGARIADEIGVSMTPVRDSLNRLVGERLVELKPGFGFHVPHLSVLDLRELLDFNLTLLRAALRGSRRPICLVETEKQGVRAAVANEAASLFRSIARVLGNQAVEDAVEAQNDRLHAIRCTEDQLMSDTASELLHLEQLCLTGTRRELELALRQYHLRRSRAAPQLLALLEHTDR
jgi:DNA-binding GntR family transcriptional regulator